MTYRELYEKALWDLEHNNITSGEFDERVKPLNQEPTRWISVSERLPEEGVYLICTDRGYVTTIMYDRSVGWITSAKVIAWMSLPEPYEAESEK